MKYCSKCGEELQDDAVVCIHCGCIPDNQHKTPNLANAKMNGKIVKTNTGKIWIASLLGGAIFGVFEMFIVGPIIGIFSGLLFGVLFGVAMQVVTKMMGNKFSAKRAEISATKTIIVEGGANLDGNGGWLFITDQSIEYYTHKMNFDNRTLIFTKAQVQSIGKEGNKLVIVANNTIYKFVVDYVDTWLQFCKHP